MEIGGFQKTSLIDYPGHLCAIIWTVGCNFRCPFCYNRDLVFGNVERIPEREIFAYLKKRKGILEAVEITGGEPTLQNDLYEFISKIKKLGYLVKLDSNGTHPQALERLFNAKLVDYIAMDIKAPPQKYRRLTGVENVNLDNIETSIKIIKNKALDYEFRTTVVPGLLTKDDIVAIAKWLKGAKKYVLQQFEAPPHLIDEHFKEAPYKGEMLQDIFRTIRPYFKKCEIRGI